MTDSDAETTEKVRHQYEQFPYPERDPAEERERLIETRLDTLDVMNHYCYKGRRDFTENFTVLIAGGGTGDSTIWLAEQLKHTNAAVFYLDISEASAEIARKRAEVRGLQNITWLHGSLLDLPKMDLPRFDYIDCSGVLHHLADPPEGLRALRAVMKDDGAMSLMVYGRYGRTGVYHVQELMRLINNDQDDSHAKVENTRAVLDCLPETSWFKMTEQRFGDYSWESGAGIYDLFLHSQDRPYTVPEVYELVRSCGLKLVTFGPPMRVFYKPEFNFKAGPLLERIKRMPLERQQAVCEIFCGVISKHEFYVSALSDTVASLSDLDNIPVGKLLEDSSPGRAEKEAWTFRSPPMPDLTVRPDKLARAAFRHMDGKRNLREILKLAAKDFTVRPSRNDIMAKLKTVFDVLREWSDLVLLRHPTSRK